MKIEKYINAFGCPSIRIEKEGAISLRFSYELYEDLYYFVFENDDEKTYNEIKALIKNSGFDELETEEIIEEYKKQIVEPAKKQIIEAQNEIIQSSSREQ